MEEALSLDFTVTKEVYSTLQKQELVPDGANIPVTNENRKGACVLCPPLEFSSFDSPF